MKTIIWAVDPSESGASPGIEGARAFVAWAASGGFAIQPVHVTTLVPHTKEKDVKQLLAARQSAVRHLAELQVEGIAEPIVTFSASTSRAEHIDTLLRIARAHRADAIAVSSHGRSGPERFVFGSFAETLLARSEIPILFLAHGVEFPTWATSRTLFATDFSEASAAAFDATLEKLGPACRELILFHQIGLPPQVEATFSAAGTLAVLPENYFEEQAAWANTEASRWGARALERGITVHPLIVNEYGEIASLILSAARRESAGLVVLASHTGPFEAAMLGSVARGVSRPHDVPVWVFGRNFRRSATILKRGAQACQP